MEVPKSIQEQIWVCLVTNITIEGRAGREGGQEWMGYVGPDG